MVEGLEREKRREVMMMMSGGDQHSPSRCATIKGCQECKVDFYVLALIYYSIPVMITSAFPSFWISPSSSLKT
jgi:hypothetical protein